MMECFWTMRSNTEEQMMKPEASAAFKEASVSCVKRAVTLRLRSPNYCRQGHLGWDSFNSYVLTFAISSYSCQGTVIFHS